MVLQPVARSVIKQMIYLPYEWYQFALKVYENVEILMEFCVNWLNSAYVVILPASVDFFFQK